MTSEHDGALDFNKQIEKIFNLRYEDAKKYMKEVITGGSKKDPISLIFWRLPLIFIEGKVIAAFVNHDKDQIVSDTVTTKVLNTGDVIFSYQGFKLLFDNMKGTKTAKQYKAFTLKRQCTEPDMFDVLDYFGFPCIERGSENAEQYLCHCYTFEAFCGRFEIWIAFHKDREQLFKAVYHIKKMRDLLKSVQTYSYSEYRQTKDKNDAKKESDYFNDMMKAIVNRREMLPQYKDGDVKFEINDYYILIFDALHKALLEDMGWKKEPNNILILFAESLYGHAMKIWFTKEQEKDYIDKYNILNLDDKKRILAEIINMSTYDKEKINFENVIEHSLKTWKDYRQCGSVSSIIKARGYYDIFLYDNIPFKMYPIIFKRDYINIHDHKYDYDSKLQDLETIMLIDVPDRTNKMSLAMIPFFIRGIAVGTVAFFAPTRKKKLENQKFENDWYQRLVRALQRIKYAEGHLEEAAVKEVCRTILDELEGKAE